MDTFEQFFKEQQALYRAKADSVWRDIQKTPGASWARALIHVCGGMQGEGTSSPEKDRPAVDCIINTFYEYFVEKEKPLSVDPYYQQARQCNGAEQIDNLRKLINGQFKRFKNHLIDQWRKKDGTFAKVYRSVQQILAGNMKDDWSMYCGGQFYGPAGIDEYCALRRDGNSYEGFWRGLGLPGEAPKESALFTFKVLGPLSKFFYERLCRFAYSVASEEPPEEQNNDIVAVRCFVCWLCCVYNLLDPHLEALSNDAAPGRAASLLPPPQHILDKFVMVASDLAVRMSADDRLLFRQLLEGVTLEAIAPLLGLSGSSSVAARRDKLATWLQSELHKYPELCASDEEGFLEIPYDYDMLREHFWSSLRDCCMPRENGGSA